MDVTERLLSAEAVWKLGGGGVSDGDFPFCPAYRPQIFLRAGWRPDKPRQTQCCAGNGTT